MIDFAPADIEINLALLLNVVVVFAVVQLYLHHRYQATIKQQDKKIKALKNDIQALLLCARGIGDKLHHQQHDFKLIQDRQDKLELSDGAGDFSYQQIIALMDRGASTDEVMNSCDLTQGEVELLSQLQKTSHKLKSNRPALVA